MENAILQQVVNDVVRWAMANLKNFTHLIDYYLLVFPYHSFHCSVLLSVVFTVWGPVGASSIDQVWHLKLLIPLWYLHSTMNICSFLTPLTTQEMNKHALFLSHTCFQGEAILEMVLLTSYFQSDRHASPHKHLKKEASTHLCYNCLMLNLKALEQKCGYFLTQPRTAWYLLLLSF